LFVVWWWPAGTGNIHVRTYRETVSAYCREVRALGFRLYGAISESLGLDGGYIKETLGEQEQHMAVNFYPRCPAPELTYGLPAHTDPNALTILLMDQQVAGLQVLKDGRWIAVNPRPSALVVNIGDQLQVVTRSTARSIVCTRSGTGRVAVAELNPCPLLLQALSNGRYKSVWHRAVVNSDRPRMSVASFLCPCNDVRIGPAAKLVTGDTPAVYRDYTYAEYYAKFWSRNLDQEHCLELFRT
jgi:isopenicillin N synthase-like dioxygenase